MIVEIGRVDGWAYGVRFVVCGNAEVIYLRCDTGDDPTGNGWKAEAGAACDAAGRVVEQAGFDYVTESSFKAYNGGPRRGMVEADVYAAKIDADGDLEPWHPVDVLYPSEIAAAVDAVANEAWEAMRNEMLLLAIQALAD